MPQCRELPATQWGLLAPNQAFELLSENQILVQ